MSVRSSVSTRVSDPQALMLRLLCLLIISLYLLEGTLSFYSVAEVCRLSTPID